MSFKYLLVAPDEANDHCVLFPTLHSIHGTNFHVFTIYWTQYGREEGDLCLVPDSSLNKLGHIVLGHSRCDDGYLGWEHARIDLGRDIWDECDPKLTNTYQSNDIFLDDHRFVFVAPAPLFVIALNSLIVF